MRTPVLMAVVLAGCAPGALWEKIDTNETATLNGIHGFSPTDVWAVGDRGTVLHFDGKEWAKVPSGTSNTLHGVWGANPNDVWIVGDSRTMLRWNGATLQTAPNAPTISFKSVRGASANEVYFCGSDDLYLFDGSFRAANVLNSSSCLSLFPIGSGVGALVPLSNAREVHRLSAGSTLLARIDNNYSGSTMVAPSATDLWLLHESGDSVYRFDQGPPRELVLPTDMSPTSGFVRNPTDVWLGGREGRMAHYDGTELTLKVAGDFDAPDIKAIWGTMGVTFAVGSKGWAMRLEE